MKAVVQAEFRLFGMIKREGEWFIAHCPPLDITTQGKSVSEAKNNLVEASQLFIISCLERGTLELALRELGFTPMRQGVQRIPANAFHLVVPIPLRFQNKVPCHV